MLQVYHIIISNHPIFSLVYYYTNTLAPSVGNVQSAIEHIYPLVEPYKVHMTAEQLAQRGSQSKNYKSKPPREGGRGRGGGGGDVVEDVIEDVLEEEEEEDAESEEIEEDMYSGSDDSDF